MGNRTIGINPYLVDYVPKDYAGNMPEGEVNVDCSLGVNASLLGNCIFERLHQFQQKKVLYVGNCEQVLCEGSFNEIKYYPHDETLKDALADWYRKHGVGTGWLTGEHFICGNGSYDILCNINLLCLTGGKKVLGHAPQFTAYVDHVNCSGSLYQAYYMKKDCNYRFQPREYIAQMSEDDDLFIVENPNNPTGQIIPIDDIKAIADRAQSLGKIWVVDEAYGEYMAFSNSAVNLIPEYPNVIVTRTFSKGWGMAGIRLGYAVGSIENNLLPCLKKLVLPFNSNAIAKALALTALRSKLENERDPFDTDTVFTNKRLLMDTIMQADKHGTPRMAIAQTASSTPIMTLYYTGKEAHFDLQAHLIKFGILAVSCKTYMGLNERAVRLMLPQSGEMPVLLEAMDKAIQALPA